MTKDVRADPHTRLVRRFEEGLDIARYTARILRSDGAGVVSDRWAGLIAARQTALAAWHPGEIKDRYLCASPQTVAALKAAFGPLPAPYPDDVAGRTAAIFAFLRLADRREVAALFAALHAAKRTGDARDGRAAQDAVDNFQTHIVPVVADIDADEPDVETLAASAIEAGACAVRLNADPGTDRAMLVQKTAACQAVFIRLGVPEGVAVARVRAGAPVALLRQKVTFRPEGARRALTMADRPMVAAIIAGRWFAASTRRAAV